MLGWLYIIYEIFAGEASQINASKGTAASQRAFNALRLIVTIGWAIYPIGYVVGYTGGGSAEGLNIIYNLADFINKGLPKAIKGNMGVPALVNRTGRFAESAEVKNITMGPRGATVAEYTYQKNPYQVFEPGNAMGSTYRDPRKIIGESVRQIAQSIMRD